MASALLPCPRCGVPVRVQPEDMVRLDDIKTAPPYCDPCAVAVAQEAEVAAEESEDFVGISEFDPPKGTNLSDFPQELTGHE